MSKDNLMERFKKLPKAEKQLIREGFNEHIVDSGRCSSVSGVEDDYDYHSEDYYHFQLQFRVWVGAYFYTKSKLNNPIIAS